MLGHQLTDNREAKPAPTGIAAARFIEAMETLKH